MEHLRQLSECDPAEWRAAKPKPRPSNLPADAARLWSAFEVVGFVDVTFRVFDGGGGWQVEVPQLGSTKPGDVGFTVDDSGWLTVDLYGVDADDDSIPVVDEQWSRLVDRASRALVGFMADLGWAATNDELAIFSIPGVNLDELIDVLAELLVVARDANRAISKFIDSQ